MKKLIQKLMGIPSPVLSINQRNSKLVYTLNDTEHFGLADDKIITKEVLEQHNIPCSKTYAIVKNIGEIPRALSRVNKHHAIAIKPAKGRGGGGIWVLKKSISGKWLKGGKPISRSTIYQHMANIIMGMFSFGSSDRVLIEQCIFPHPFFHEIYPEGVPDIRIILVKNEPVLAMLRVPTKKSGGKANLHQGGLGIGVDMETGTLTDAYDGNKYHRTHPDSGSTIYGKLIPEWEQVMDVAIRTSKAFPLEYLGIDIVIDKTLGPLILEINVRPGLGIQLVNKTGLRKAINALSNQHSKIPTLK